MKCVIVAEFSAGLENYVNEMKKELKEKFGMEVDEFQYSINKEIKRENLQGYELIVTVDLVGFDNCTLTDGLSYNLIDSKFINLLLHDNLPNEKYLSKQLSISMFFYCRDKAYFDYLLGTYPEIPYLKCLEGWKENTNSESVKMTNLKCIVSAIEDVIRECRL